MCKIEIETYLMAVQPCTTLLVPSMRIMSVASGTALLYRIYPKYSDVVTEYHYNPKHLKPDAS